MERRGAADVIKWFLFMATGVIGELSFGDSFRTLEIGEHSELYERPGRTRLSRCCSLCFSDTYCNGKVSAHFLFQTSSSRHEKHDSLRGRIDYALQEPVGL